MTITPDPILDNIVWHTLCGLHAPFAVGTNTVKRYAPGFSPVTCFSEPDNPDFEALSTLCDPGEAIFCEGWAGATPAGWKIHMETRVLRLVWNGDAPQEDPAPEAILLRTEHIEQAVSLAELTRPGPFGPRTIELGEYFGVFDGNHLVSMAGERFCAGTYREISGVCTHPDHRGQGYATRLMKKLILRQTQRGEIPFLHVISDNHAARDLYLAMGFEIYRESALRVISRA